MKKKPIPEDLLAKAMREIEKDDAKEAETRRDEAKVEKMRGTMEAFVDKRLREYFDASPRQYADMQNLNSLRGRIQELEERRIKADAFDLRLKLLEVEVARSARAVLKRGFFARIFGG